MVTRTPSIRCFLGHCNALGDREKRVLDVSRGLVPPEMVSCLRVDIAPIVIDERALHSCIAKGDVFSWG